MEGMRRWWTELGLAGRRLVRAPGFTLVSVGTLALALAAFGSVFAVVSGVLLKPMPYAEPEDLTWVWRDYWGDFPRGWLSGLDVTMLREHDDVFQGVAAVRSGRSNLSAGDGTGATDVRLILGSPGYLRLLGVEPLLGPGFTPTGETGEWGDLLEEVVLHHDLWRRAFAEDPDVVGRTVYLDGEPFQVVGVMPPWFDFRQSSSLGTAVAAEAYLTNRVDLAAEDVFSGSFAGLARVAPGVPQAAVDAALTQVAGELDRNFNGRGLRLWTAEVREDLVADLRRPLLAVLGAAGFLLLILGANLATLFLARSGEQMRAAAVRSALGAGRPALLRAALAEPILIGVAGLAVGALLAGLGTHLLAEAVADTLPRSAEIRFDAGGWGGVAVAVLAVVALSALGPVVRWVRVDPSRGMDGGRTGSTPSAERARSGLVMVQVGLALTLLMGSGLLFRSVQGLLAQDPGFDVETALTFRVGVQGPSYEDGASVLEAQEALRQAFEALPGVRSAGYANALPLSLETNQFQASFPDHPVQDPRDASQLVDVFAASPGYVESMGLRLLDGRPFEVGDGTEGRPFVLVDDLLAARYFPEGEAVGGRMVIRGDDTVTVAGVVDQPRLYSVREDDRGQVFLPAPMQVRSDTRFVLALEAGLLPESLMPAVRRTVLERDPGLAISQVASARDIVRGSLASERMNVRLALVFALSAVVLAGLGLYGIVAGTVIRRRREIGLRMAMGADGRTVVRSVVVGGMRVVLAGAVGGVALSWVVSRWISSLLFGVSPFDPPTLVGAAGILVLTALGASWLPARRAVRIPPSVALRTD